VKKVLLVLFSVILLATGTFGLAACSKSAPEFTGDPVNITGNFRWEKDLVYLDVVITNNTNKEIKRIWFNGNHYATHGSETDWELRGGFSTSFPSATKKKPTIKAGQSQSWSFVMGSPIIGSDTGIVEYYTAYKCNLTISKIEFANYGLMPFETPIAFTFEGRR